MDSYLEGGDNQRHHGERLSYIVWLDPVHYKVMDEKKRPDRHSEQEESRTSL